MFSTFFPFRGGIAQFNTELFKALEEKAQVQAFNFSTQYPNLLFPGKTQFVDQKDLAPNFKTPQYLSSINPLTFNKTASAIKKYNPDVLITSYWMPFFAPSLGSVCKKLKKAKLEIFEGGDHSFKMLKKTGIPHEEVIEKLGFDKMELKADVSEAADVVMTDKGHLDPNPIPISKEDVIQCLNDINSGNL